MESFTSLIEAMPAWELVAWGVVLFSFLYSAAIFGLYMRNRAWFAPLATVPRSANETTASRSPSTLSVCIPARNEERTIGKLLESLLSQTEPPHEILVLDDDSTDATAEVLSSFAEREGGRIRILRGVGKPDGWLGKPWACHQLSMAATGDVLLFLDADVRVEPGFCAQILRIRRLDGFALLTVWPLQELGSFWERVVIPVVYFTLLSLLPIPYQHRKPRWMPQRIYSVVRWRFAAACGQCMIFDRDAYEAIGGHEAVRMEIVEDVALARRIRHMGKRLVMASGHDAVSCRMYRDQRGMYAGFRKNFLAGFDDAIPVFLFMGLLHLAVYLGPSVIMLIGAATGHLLLSASSIAPLAVISFHRRHLDTWMGWMPDGYLTHPLAVLWFQRLAARSLLDRLSKAPVEWKGRNVR